MINKLIPGWKKRYEQAVKHAEGNFTLEKDKVEKAEIERKENLDKYKAQYEKEKGAWDLKVQQRNREVDDFEQSYRNIEISSVISYNSMVLERSGYPDEFPQNFRVTYADDSKELLIEYQLPIVQIVPTVQEYKYVKSRDTVDCVSSA